jgi:folate-binding protein YgfZ
LLESQLSDLKKYAVFSKSTLSDDSAAWLRLGLHNADELLSELGLLLPTEADGVARGDNLFAIRLPDGRIELWANQAISAEVLQQIRSKLPEQPLNTWLLAQVRAGIGQVFGATRELFIPQMINLQAVGGVSFKKGCYTGQEIVARMQYLGKLKRRLQRLSLEGAELPAVASELFSPVHRSSVGEVVLAAQSETGVELLAVLQEDAVSDGRIHLGSETGPALQLLDLPYTLNSDREIQR